MASMDDIRVGLKVTVDEAQKQAVTQTEAMVAGLGAKVASMSTAATAGIGVVLAGVAGTAAAMIATVGAASKFEDSFAGIKKTVNATDVEFEKLAGNIRRMAVDIPIATSQLNAIGEIGGQLGISAAGLTKFIDTIAKLGVATRLSTESAALGLARLREIFQLSENDFDNLASTLVDLGNNFAAIEDEILNTALRLAAGGKIAGATAQDVLALATALQAVGVQSQAGGTAISRVFQQIRIASTTGGAALATFANVTGLTNEQFKELANQDAAQAFNVFLLGLQRISDGGGNVIAVLEDLGLKQQRTIRALLSLAEAGDLVGESLAVANSAYIANIALNDEATKRFETFKSQTKLLNNAFQELRIEIGTFFLPAAKAMVETLTMMFKIFDSNNNSTKGFTTTVAGLTAVIVGLGLAFSSIIKPMMLLRFNTKATGVATGELIANFDTYKNQLSVTKDQLIAGQKAMKRFRMGLLGITAALAVISIGYAIFKKRQEQNLQATQRFLETGQVLSTLQEDLAEKQNTLNELTAEGSNVSEDYIKAKEIEIEKLEELLGLIEQTNIQSFFDASRIELSDEQSKRIVESYEDLFNALSQFDAIEGVSDFDFNAQIAEAIGLSESEAQALYSQGIGAFLDAVAAGEAAGLDSMDKVFNTFQKIRGILTADTLNPFDTKFNKEFKNQIDILREYNDVLILLTKGFLQSNMSQEQQDEVLQRLLDRYNEANDLTGEFAFTLQDVKNSEELLNKVIQQSIDSLEGLENNTKNNSIAMQDLAQQFLNAEKSASDFIQELDKLNSLDVVSGDGLVAGFDKMQDRLISANFLVAQLVSKGFPALAKQAQDLPLDERIGHVTALLGTANHELQDMEGHLVSNVAGFEEFVNTTDEGLQMIIDGLTGGIEESAAQEALKNTFTEFAVSKRGEELQILNEIVRMQESSRKVAEGILQAQSELVALTEDLSYQGITISQIDIRRMEAKEAQLAFEEAIAEYGAEGVITSNEQLKLLQMTLNIDRMRDKLSQQMTARERKRIRDKEKEVQFLELAVEQGVAEQLDLDAAKEELDELKKPLSDTDRQILELQKEIAEAQKVAYEARMEAVSPEVLSAMQNVVDKEKDLANFANEVASAQNNVAEAYAAARIEADKNKAKLHELMIMYPNMQGMIKELADSIGIPAEITQAVLVEMEKSRAAYESELSIMNSDYEAFIAEIATKPIVFTADTSQVDNAINRLTSTGRSQGIVNMFGDPDEYFGRVREYSTAPLTETGRSQGIVNMFGDPDEYFGRYSGGIIPVGRYSTVGEAGPEKVMSLRGGGSMVFPNKTGGGGNGITVDNMNINITGLPADPITARKVALNIRKELTKLEKEGNAGTGLLNR